MIQLQQNPNINYTLVNEEGHTRSTKKYNLAEGKEIKYQRFALGHRKEERMCIGHKLKIQNEGSTTIVPRQPS